MINKYTFLFIQLFVSFTASACSFENIIQSLPLFILSGVLIGLSFWLLLHSLSSKKTIIFLVACILIAPVVFVANYRDFYPCTTPTQLLASLELTASTLVISLSGVVWFWVKHNKP